VSKDRDIAFEMAASSVRYGAGVTRELGADLADRGHHRVMVVTDRVVAALPPVAAVLETLERHKIHVVLYDYVRVEPTDASLRDAIEVASRESCDAFVAVGGGSAIDTAKIANLYSTHPPADFLDYVNPPIGKGHAVPGPLRPLFAIPTTAGTGSETTGVAVFDLERMHVKTGISSRLLKPTLGYLDPEHTRTLPPPVTASAGLDVLCHAVESYTVIPFTDRPRPSRPALRPTYQGSNPISDVWSLQALRMVATYLVRAFDNPDDDEARGHMLLAASFAGIGFGSAGVRRRRCEAVLRARISGRSPACAARVLGDPQCTCGVPLHGVGESRAASFRRRGARRGCVARQKGGCGACARRPHHLVHAAAQCTRKSSRGRLQQRRHSDARSRHAGAGAVDHALSARG